jgi:proline iminopeptidase
LSSSLFSQSQKEPEGKYVVVGGHRLWYRIVGKGEPLLLVPGGPGASHTYFWPFFDRLTDSFQVIYFDAFGRGKSDGARDAREYSYTHDVDEVEGLRQALGLGQINLYGQSYGGVVAQGYALRYPKSLKRLILANTLYSAEMWQIGNNENSNEIITTQYPEVRARLDSLRSLGILSCDSVYQAIQAEVPMGLLYFYNPLNEQKVSLQVNLEVYRQIAGPDADVILGGDIVSLDFRAKLSTVKVPTLILSGRFDHVSTPRYAIQFKSLMPRAQFVMFEQSGHMPFVEEPQLHDAILREFLKK